ncbi:hypothetical protein EW145_g5201 [Phellinidium pouzarii]|uniref:Phosphatidylglycerol lysyltransferase C-terminal domain-containing protein n=1 Tax=Phellinidium pouzarii TaxID=167371 RepID=A0A4S4L107_9AGAM|nr:hypothetical protein EW145_g5201 [Phellinidium pouzarii]
MSQGVQSQANINGQSSQLPPIEDLIAKYGDSSNTTMIEEKFSVWRHPHTGAAIGYSLSNPDSKHTYCIVWGTPLCEPSQVQEVIGAFLAWVKEQDYAPIWSCADNEVERVLTERHSWRAIMCVQEDALDPTRANPEQNKEVRKHIRKAQRAGCTIVEEDGVPSDEIQREIDSLIEEWKENRKGTQVHTTDVKPWRDIAHRKYFYSRDAEGKIVGFLFLAKIADGWAIKDSIQVRSAPKSLTEWLIASAIHSLADKGERYLTFGPTPAPNIQSAENSQIPSSSFKFLSKTYTGIERSFLGNKREFRKKFEVEGEPIFSEMLFDFGDLDLTDEGSSRDREDRMRAAFKKSKQSYAKERVTTEPGWYDPPEIPAPTKLHVRNIDYSLNNLYLRREYSQLLPLALSQIETEEVNVGGDGREQQLVDLAMRCALKLRKTDLAGQLADKAVHKWPTNIGLTSISAEAYLAYSRPRDALSASLLTISRRGALAPYISLLYRSLEGLSEKLGTSDALESILQMIRPHFRPQIEADENGTLDEDTANKLVSACGIVGSDQERLVALLCHRPSAEKENHEERSVKTL